MSRRSQPAAPRRPSQRLFRCGSVRPLPYQSAHHRQGGPQVSGLSHWRSPWLRVDLLLAGCAGVALVPRPPCPGSAGSGPWVARATSYRYLDEVIAVSVDQAPDVHKAPQHAQGRGLEYVILNGRVLASDRCTETTTSTHGYTIDLWYAGKAGEQGGNIQALSVPTGIPLWTSDVEPESSHDRTCARQHALYATARGLPTLADSGYEGAVIGVHTPVKQPPGPNGWPRTTGPTTRCCGVCAGSANAASPCSPKAGRPGNTSPPALAHYEHGTI